MNQFEKQNLIMTQATIQLFGKQKSPRYFESDSKNMEFVSKKPCKRLEPKLNGTKRLGGYSNRNDEASYQQKLQRFCLIRNNVRNAPKNINENSLFSIKHNGTSSLDSKLKKIFQMNPNQNFNGITSTAAARPQPKKTPSTFPMAAESNTSTDNSTFNPILLQNLINTVIATQQQQQQQQQQEQKQKEIIQSALIKLLLGTQSNESVTTALLDTLIEILDQPQNGLSETNMPLYKTELCRNFEETGDCRYKEKCQFAHGSHEIRNLQRHLKYKTELCRSYHNIGFCPYGIRCHFVHNIEEVRTSTKPATASNSQHNIFSNMFTSMLSLEQTGLVGNLLKTDSQMSLGCHTNTENLSDIFMNSLSSKSSSTSLNSLLCDNKPI